MQQSVNFLVACGRSDKNTLETTTAPRRAARRQPRRRGSACSLAAPRRPGLGQRPCSKARVKFSSRDSLPRRSNVRRNVRFGGSVVEVREISTVSPDPFATATSGNVTGNRKSSLGQHRAYSGLCGTPSLQGVLAGAKPLERGVWTHWRRSDHFERHGRAEWYMDEASAASRDRWAG